VVSPRGGTIRIVGCWTRSAVDGGEKSSRMEEGRIGGLRATISEKAYE
jgi:hypothetical protein